MKLLIRNLARTTTEAEVRALFEAHGHVQSCTLVMDEKSGASKGFGFIDMPKAGEAKAAMKNLNGKEIAESKIRVKRAETKSETEKVETTVNTEPKKSEPQKAERIKPKEKKSSEFQGWKNKGK